MITCALWDIESRELVKRMREDLENDCIHEGIEGMQLKLE
jgi:hypothetical protein